MSENITHTAVADDAARLGQHLPLPEPFLTALRLGGEALRLAGVTRSGDLFTVALLTQYRDAWTGDAAQVAKLAFVLGWLCHRACDRQMKPVFRAADPDCALSPRDCSIYHDVFLLREHYAGGADEPYAPDLFTGEAGAVEEAFRVMWMRALLAMHTLIPDYTDPDGWLERLLKHRQEMRVDLRRYAEAIANPDPDKVRRFIVEPGFYDPADPIIRAARALRLGDPLPLPVADALAAPPRSLYARAVTRSLRYITAAGAYWRREIDQAELERRLDIGVPELAG